MESLKFIGTSCPNELYDISEIFRLSECYNAATASNLDMMMLPMNAELRFL
jgi:hypothetical protein